jgi:hypothetical protein
MGRKDAEGTFVRETCRLRLAGAGGNVVCVTAGGRLLGNIVGANGQQCDPRRAWAEWLKLPAAERSPGPIGELGPIDPLRQPATPPPGGLILRQHYRMLATGPKGELRHVALEDFVHHKLLGTYYPPKAKRHLFEAAPDFLWLTEAEWKALVPPAPKKGDRFAAPAALTERLFRFHLVPDITFGESNGWEKKGVRGGTLTVTVEEATAAGTLLRLEGHARLGLDEPTARERCRGGKVSSANGYEPALLGYLHYDARRKVVDRFDLVALGGFYGTLIGDNRRLYRSGRTPLGVAFELVTAAGPAADRQVPPRATRGLKRGERRYFGKE